MHNDGDHLSYFYWPNRGVRFKNVYELGKHEYTNTYLSRTPNNYVYLHSLHLECTLFDLS
jgi:hypothetical protein